MDHQNLTAPCGIDCFNCQMLEGNITEQLKNTYAALLKKSPDEVACQGCRTMNGCRLHYQSCDLLDCVKTKRVEFCYQCPEFPCSMLEPALDGADKYPHNLKLYNLCRIQRIGVEEWAKEASLIRLKYFKGKFVVGKGPVLE